MLVKVELLFPVVLCTIFLSLWSLHPPKSTVDDIYTLAMNRPCVVDTQNAKVLPAHSKGSDTTTGDTMMTNNSKSVSNHRKKNPSQSTLDNHGSLHRYPDPDSPAVLPKILAIYFPQFHRDPLNDRLWGDGFTDWDNLRQAPKVNRKNYPIMRPTELGYYDLTNITVRRRQGELAKEYGVDGFVYHHYWFYDDAHPGPTLHAPLMKMLDDGHPDLPFALNWVAGDWTATWHRRTENQTQFKREREASKTVLQKQFFPDATHPKIIAHYRWLRLFFHHHNYIKVNGMPVLMCYGLTPPGIIAKFKELAVEDGFPGLYVTLGTYQSHDILFPRGIGKGLNVTLEGELTVFDRITNYPFPFDWLRREKMAVPEWCVKKNPMGQARVNNIVGVVTSFDNTPRRELRSARLWVTRDGLRGVTRHFRKNLWAAVHYHTCCFEPDGTDQFVLINAWNEWAEGMALEPSDVFQRSFLEVVKATKERHSTCRQAEIVGAPSREDIATTQ